MRKEDVNSCVHPKDACPISENDELMRIIHGVAHRLPQTPGEECPRTKADIAFRRDRKRSSRGRRRMVQEYQGE